MKKSVEGWGSVFKSFSLTVFKIPSRWSRHVGVRGLIAAGITVLGVHVIGCSSTRVVRTSKLPGVSVDLAQLSKVIVVARTKEEASRKVAEDRMASYHKSFRVSYSEFSNREIMGDENRFKENLKRQGYDGILTIRFLGKGKETRYVQGTYIPGNYVGSGVAGNISYNPGYYLPGYYRETAKNWIQVDVFSLRKSQLLWSGVTETINVSGIDKTVVEVMDEVRKQMIRDKFIISE